MRAVPKRNDPAESGRPLLAGHSLEAFQDRLGEFLVRRRMSEPTMRMHSRHSAKIIYYQSPVVGNAGNVCLSKVTPCLQDGVLAERFSGLVNRGNVREVPESEDLHSRIAEGVACFSEFRRVRCREEEFHRMGAGFRARMATRERFAGKSSAPRRTTRIPASPARLRAFRFSVSR